MRKNITSSIFALALLCSSSVIASAASSTVEFEVSQLTVVENGETLAHFRVRRTGDLTDAATVALTRVDGTSNELDFDAYPGTIDFAPGVSVVEGSIIVREDEIYETTEYFSLRLIRPSPNVRLGSQHTMKVFIDDLADYPKIRFYRLGMKVEPAAGRQVVASVCVGPDPLSVEATAISFGSSDGTATAGNDYTAIGGTITFEPLVRVKCIQITILGDGLNEPRETFNVNLFNPVNAGVLNSPGQFKIINSVPYAQHIDSDGNGLADFAAYDPATANWFTYQYPMGILFGTSTDVIVPGDYTGDGQTDSAFWRPATGDWYVLRSEDGSYYAVHFGATGDIPVPADFDGDGIADYAVFRPPTGTWYIRRSSDGSVDVVRFGREGDRPTPADFDGDWKADVAVYRPNPTGSSEWWIKGSSNSAVSVTTFGEASDHTTAGDYTGDGKADIAFYRRATRQWFVMRSEDQSFYIFQSFGGEIPAPGDYSGDGRSDYANYHSVDRIFHVDSSDGSTGSIGWVLDPSATLPLAIANVH